VPSGPGSTDLLYSASGDAQLPGAIFAATDIPAQYNGIKMRRAGAAPISSDPGRSDARRSAEKILDGSKPSTEEGKPRGAVTERDLLSGYADYLRELVDLSEIRPLKVVMDSGNGMGGHTVPAVFGKGLPLEVVPLYFELDGTFPNHPANPMDPDNLRSEEHTSELQSRFE